MLGGAIASFSAPWRHIENLPLYSCALHTMQSHICPERLNVETVNLFFLLPPHCREGSIIVGYEVTGSSNTAELLSALEQVAEEAQVAMKRRFSVEDGSFRVFGKGKAGSVFR